MDLCEWDAKARLRAHGLPVPRARLLDPASDAGSVGEADILKAQLLAGGRGKAGLVRRAGADPRAAVAEIAGKVRALGLPPVLMVEEPVEIAAELYLGLVIDDLKACPVLMFSPEGGVEIEEGAGVKTLALPPDGTVRAHDLVPFLRDAGAPAEALSRLSRLAADLAALFRAEDATLVEINPLAVTASGRLVALDCKMVLDDSARYRHRGLDVALSRRLAEAGLAPEEREGRDKGFILVRMPGDVALITAGAGLGMLCSDLLADAGFRAATFFDNAAGQQGETAEARLDLAWRLAEEEGIKAIVFYQALATRDLAPRVEGLLERLRKNPPPKPFYFGLSASFVAERTMTAKAARAAIEEAGYPAFEFPEDLVARMRADLLDEGAA